MIDLIKQYKETLNQLLVVKEKANEKDKKIMNSMIRDIEDSLKWMRTGKEPGLRRGIERRSAYQRERPLDPVLMQRYFRSIDDNTYEWDNHQKEHTLGEWEIIKLEDALSVLTEREKEAYLMSRGHCLTYSDISKYLGVTRSTVQTMITRAEKKIAKRVHESLFCLCS
ncbi:RNA polymerase subunit sigma-70 [Bacillus cereus]|nr:RNA polymerase subunit sigma-70 [Bacillus cereus]PGU62325.1 RNA polymerase subunit sigma-70 [Bacillus cereus]